jgi:chromosome segregation ATPase
MNFIKSIWLAWTGKRWQMLLTQLEKIMSVISEFAAKQDVHNAQIDAAVTGLSADVAELNAEIAKLKASQGEVSAEDKALLDAIETRTATIADKLTALDALTPPVVPAEPNVGGSPGSDEPTPPPTNP